MFDRVLNTPMLIYLTRGYHKVSLLEEKLGPKKLSNDTSKHFNIYFHALVFTHQNITVSSDFFFISQK